MIILSGGRWIDALAESRPEFSGSMVLIAAQRCHLDTARHRDTTGKPKSVGLFLRRIASWAASGSVISAVLLDLSNVSTVLRPSAGTLEV